MKIEKLLLHDLKARGQVLQCAGSGDRMGTAESILDVVPFNRSKDNLPLWHRNFPEQIDVEQETGLALAMILTKEPARVLPYWPLRIAQPARQCYWKSVARWNSSNLLLLRRT